MIRITDAIAIDEGEIKESFIHASGPGGQNVNKVSTAVRLRFDAAKSPAIAPEVLRRLALLAGSRMTGDGVLIIHARRFRTREQNRRDAMDRLTGLIRRAALEPKPRLRTKPSRAARERRLKAKRLRSRTKKIRRPVSPREE